MTETESLPNLIWATMESTRMDHTSLSGYHRDTTPELTRIAESNQGTSFDSCYSHGIWSRSSIGSILTGLAPSRHRAGYDLDRIPNQIETIAEKLRKKGYKTCCISANPHLNSSTGLDSGFTDFVYLNKSTVLEHIPLITLMKYGVLSYWHSGGLTSKISNHNLGYLLNQIAKKKIKRFRSEEDPFFIYIHYIDPHHPYNPPPAYQSLFLDKYDVSAKEMRRVTREMSINHHKYIANGCNFSEKEWSIIRTAYDTQIYYTDKLIGNLFEFVKAADEDNSKFVVTADHGELFGERGLLTHKITVNDAISNVPLVLHGFNKILKKESEIVQHSDVMKTFLNHVGVDTSKLAGVNLSEDTREYAFIQRGKNRSENNIEKFQQYNSKFQIEQFDTVDMTAIRSSKYRLEWTKEGTRLIDPQTETQVSDAKIEDYLSSVVGEWMETTGKPIEPEETETAEEFDADVAEHLKDLGYI